MVRSVAAAMLLVWGLGGAARAEVIEADSADLQKLIADGVTVVDIRTRDEWRETGVIEGSHLLTFFDEQGRYDVPGWLAELDKIARPNERIAVICAVGTRSMMLTHFLDTKAGYSNVINVTRGIVTWIQEGHPTVPYQ